MGILPNIPVVGESLSKVAKWLGRFQTIIGIIAITLGILYFGAAEDSRNRSWANIDFWASAKYTSHNNRNLGTAGLKLPFFVFEAIASNLNFSSQLWYEKHQWILGISRQIY